MGDNNTEHNIVYTVCVHYTLRSVCALTYIHVPGEVAAGGAGVEGREEVRGLLGPAPDGDPMGRYLEEEEEEEEEEDDRGGGGGGGGGGGDDQCIHRERERKREEDGEGERRS